MTDKQLRRLSKDDLLDIIIQLKKNEEELKERLAQAEEKAAARETRFTETGNMAEAALEINGVLAAAQKAADDYLAMVHSSNAEFEALRRTKLDETEARCERMIRDTEQAINARWTLFRKKVTEVLQQHEELSGLMSEYNPETSGESR